MTTEVTTRRAFYSAPFDTTVKRHVYPNDVRIPTTLDECEKALDLCDTNIVGLSDVIARRRADGDEVAHLEGTLEAWERKRAEIAYVEAKLNAPESQPSEPSIELAIARRRIDDLEAALAKAVAKAKRPDTTERQIADLERQNRDLTKRLESFKAQSVATETALREQISALKSQPSITGSIRHESVSGKDIRHRKAIHDQLSLTFAAVVEMVEAGASLTPLAAFVTRKLTNEVPEGFFATWCADSLRFINASARENFVANAELATQMIRDEIERRGAR